MSHMLHLVTCGAPLASRANDGIREAQQRGWDVALLPTEAAMKWIDRSSIDLPPERIITDQREANESKRLPSADSIAVAPMTFNTLTAWANGRANTYALSTLCAALGARIPAVAVPFAKHDLAGHPAWLASLAVLRYTGVHLVDTSTGALNHPEPIDSGSGQRVTDDFQWSWVLDPLDR